MLYKPKYENRRALVIGINKYQHVSPLAFACSDAEALSKLLVEKFAFIEDDITLLCDDEASKDKILEEFHRFTQEKTQPDDKILVFFAGHGHTITGNRGEVGFLVPVGGKPNDTSTLIRWDDLTRNAELIRAKHVLFIMDACYGGLAITRAPSVGSRRFVKDMCQRYSRPVITAGKADETVADAGGPLPNHSIFTGHLLQGLDGAAVTGLGIITANGIMSYVYEKVGSDPNSHQTPHYGYVEGDGDFISTEEALDEASTDSSQDKDLLISVSSALDEAVTQPGAQTAIKGYIADPSKRIILHDLAMQYVRKFLSETSADKMPVSASSVSNDYLAQRFKAYEESLGNLLGLFSAVSHWGDRSQVSLLEKALQRLTDNCGLDSGVTVLLHMRWYPICVLEYAAGISALAAQKYNTLLAMLTTEVDCRLSSGESRNVIAPLSDAMVELHHVFTIFPGHERNFVPRSEYLYELLQPEIEDILFLGESYERLFDRFELFMALVYADLTNMGVAPIGRFGYKYRRHHNGPFVSLLEEAKSQKDSWPPLKAGLFGGSYSRFEEISQMVRELIGRISWF